jgi:hypothetical protein
MVRNGTAPPRSADSFSGTDIFISNLVLMPACAANISMSDPCTEDFEQVRGIESDDIVQTFATYRCRSKRMLNDRDAHLTPKRS